METCACDDSPYQPGQSSGFGNGGGSREKYESRRVRQTCGEVAQVGPGGGETSYRAISEIGYVEIAVRAESEIKRIRQAR